jgi:hypothetical protein
MTWVLVLIVTHSVAVTMTNIPGYTTHQRCVIAGSAYVSEMTAADNWYSYTFTCVPHS